jgi:hypothetical protein
MSWPPTQQDLNDLSRKDKGSLVGESETVRADLHNDVSC